MASKKSIPEKKAGRKSSFDEKYIKSAAKYAEYGFTDKELAELFNVTLQTVTNWKRQFPLFFASLKKGKLLADDKVVASLYERATGYSHPDVHILRDGEIIPIVKHYPPDVGAIVFWLKNRQPKHWRDKKEISFPGDDDPAAVKKANAEISKVLEKIKSKGKSKFTQK